MRICFLAHGGSIHTRSWARYFRDEGHEVSIISLTPAEPEPGIDLYCAAHVRESSVERTNWHYLRSLPRLWRVVRRVDPDLLNAHFLSSYGFLGALVRPAGVPLVISLHGSDVLVIPDRSPVHNWAARFALRRADLVTSVAEHMTRRVRELMGEEKLVLTLQYGVMTDRFHQPERIKGRRPTCLSVRRLVPVANIETILAAAKIVLQGGSALSFVFANWGYLRPELERLASDWGIDEQVTFVGRIGRDAMANSLREAAIYVSMTSSDGMALSLLEAMACGAFPVVSDIPANREWIEHGVNGYLVPLGDPQRLANCLMEAWHNEALRLRAAEENWRLVQDKGDYWKNMNVIETEFLKLLR